MSEPISSFSGEGAWIVHHTVHYEAAHAFRDEYLEKLAQLTAEEERLYQAHSNSFQESIRGFIGHETNHLLNACSRAADAAILFACMSFEAFLNFYGIRRLGDDYYKRFVERLGVSEKLAYITSVCSSRLVAPDDPIIVRSRRLFDLRNSLVHPKARTVDFDRPDDFVSKHPKDWPITQHFDDLEFCIYGFCDTDTNINRDHEFPKRKP